MAEQTKIQWTHHTFNPWIGCTKVSDGCRNCYAEHQNKHRRWNGGRWGPGAPRSVTSAHYWRQPLAWNREAEAEGRRDRVFCASLADVFDAEAPEGARDWLWELIGQTPHLDWLLLTKRPERIAQCLPAGWGDGWSNVWLGTSVEDQRAADLRIPELARVPAAVRFLSCEPLIGPVTLALSGLHWVIVGGEGIGGRPMHLDWARSIKRQCDAAGTLVFMKQLGKTPCDGEQVPVVPLRLHDRKGGDPEEWPQDLRVRDVPVVATA